MILHSGLYNIHAMSVDTILLREIRMPRFISGYLLTITLAKLSLIQHVYPQKRDLYLNI